MIIKFKTQSGTVNREQFYFLTDKQFDELNKIGYTGKNSSGMNTDFQKYLNSLKIGFFEIMQIKFDNGNFTDEYVMYYNLNFNDWKYVKDETPPINIELLVKDTNNGVDIATWRPSYNIFTIQNKNEDSNDWQWKLID